MATHFLLPFIGSTSDIPAILSVTGFGVNLFALVLFRRTTPVAREFGVRYFYLSTLGSDLAFYTAFPSHLLFLILAASSPTPPPSAFWNFLGPVLWFFLNLALLWVILGMIGDLVDKEWKRGEVFLYRSWCIMAVLIIIESFLSSTSALTFLIATVSFLIGHRFYRWRVRKRYPCFPVPSTERPAYYGKNGPVQGFYAFLICAVVLAPLFFFTNSALVALLFEGLKSVLQFCGISCSWVLETGATPDSTTNRQPFLLYCFESAVSTLQNFATNVREGFSWNLHIRPVEYFLITILLTSVFRSVFLPASRLLYASDALLFGAFSLRPDKLFLLLSFFWFFAVLMLFYYLYLCDRYFQSAFSYADTDVTMAEMHRYFWAASDSRKGFQIIFAIFLVGYLFLLGLHTAFQF